MDKHVLSYPKTLSRKHLSAMENAQSLLSPTYMRISILLSIRLSKCWTLKRSTFLMSYISPQAGATSALEMKINDWEVQIWRASLWQASHLATFSKFTWQRQAKKTRKARHEHKWHQRHVALPRFRVLTICKVMSDNCTISAFLLFSF